MLWCVSNSCVEEWLFLAEHRRMINKSDQINQISFSPGYMGLLVKSQGFVILSNIYSSHKMLVTLLLECLDLHIPIVTCFFIVAVKLIWVIFKITAWSKLKISSSKSLSMDYQCYKMSL